VLEVPVVLGVLLVLMDRMEHPVVVVLKELLVREVQQVSEALLV